MYKTIVLEILQQQPAIHDQLRKKRMLLATLNLYASQLKASHETWKCRLSETKPHSDPSQIASEALEIALTELESRLRAESPPNEAVPLSLEAAMEFIRPTPPA